MRGKGVGAGSVAGGSVVSRASTARGMGTIRHPKTVASVGRTSLARSVKGDVAEEPVEFDVSAVAASVGPSSQLLEYYRNRISEFEAERAAFLERFEAVENSHEEIHRLKWELKVREEEVVELQKALSDANVYLYDEREQVLRLQAENDALKIQEMEDRRKIQHLLALTKPVAQEVTFFRDCRPEKLTRFPVTAKDEDSGDLSASMRGGIGAGDGGGGGSAGPATPGASSFGRSGFAMPPTPSRTPGASSVPESSASKSRTGGSPSKDKASAIPAASGVTGARVLRTVYLPSERADALLATVMSLQDQLSAAKRMADERTKAWREDRQARDEAASRKAEADRAALEEAERQLKLTQEKLTAITKDYLQLRHASQVASRELKEQVAACTASERQAREDLARVRADCAAQVESIRRTASKESDNMREFNRAAAAQRDDDLRTLKEQYSEVQTLHKKRVDELEARSAHAKQRYRNLQRRRNLELEGYTRDITHMRQALRQLEAQWATVGLARGPDIPAVEGFGGAPFLATRAEATPSYTAAGITRNRVPGARDPKATKGRARKGAPRAAPKGRAVAWVEPGVSVTPPPRGKKTVSKRGKPKSRGVGAGDRDGGDGGSVSKAMGTSGASGVEVDGDSDDAGLRVAMEDIQNRIDRLTDAVSHI